MTKTQNLFFSCIESRIEDHGSLYGRFHIGTFFRGQALTFANALRRTLLSEIPGVRITDIYIHGATHEFAILPGVEESVLDILFNLKRVVFAPCTSKVLPKSDSYPTNDVYPKNSVGHSQFRKIGITNDFWKGKGNGNRKELDTFQAQAILRGRGPTKLTAGDIKLPLLVKCVNPETPIATLTGDSEFLIQFSLSLSPVQNSSTSQKKLLTYQQKQILNFESVSMPIQKVNYGIKSLNAKQGSEYIIFEVWTDGSLLPQEAVDFGLKQLTHLFYQFASFQKKTVRS